MLQQLMIGRHLLAAVVLCIFLVLFTTPASGVEVDVQVKEKVFPQAAAGTGKLTLYAYERLLGGNGNTYNSFTSSEIVDGVLRPATEAFTVGGKILFGGRPYPVGLAGTPGRNVLYGVSKIDKPAASARVASRSSDPSRGAPAVSAGALFLVNPGSVNKLSVNARINGAVCADAAAQAVDPDGLEPIIYSMFPVLDSASIIVEAQGEFAGFSFFGFDSRSTDMLWELHVSARDKLTDRSDLDIKFLFDAARLPDLSGLAEIIEDRVRDHFTFLEPGKATFSEPLELFPRPVQYDLRGTSDVEFGVGVAGGVASSDVPEPSTWILCGIGGVCLLGYCWRRRKQAASTVAGS